MCWWGFPVAFIHAQILKLRGQGLRGGFDLAPLDLEPLWHNSLSVLPAAQKGLLRNKGCFQWVKWQWRRWGRKSQSICSGYIHALVVSCHRKWLRLGPIWQVLPKEVCMINKERGETPWSGRGCHSQHWHERPCPSSVLKLSHPPSFKLLRMVLSGGLLGSCHSPGFYLLWWKTMRQSWQELGRKFSRHQILMKLSLTLN